ncbi:phage antirepressor KilAC domain-containing protein [Clostridium sp.]|uniref:phage antirepressor KilAC domain-containing protein n=1 Tax=Clostridium sp. TaxID=1506 RepID=UPI002FCACB0C
MSNIQIFKEGLFEVALKLDNGEVLFDAERVARSLGFISTSAKHGRTYKNIRWSRVNEYLKFPKEVGRGDFITESAVYKLAFKASNEIAERFQHWLAVEVLPSIRKHGTYMTPEKLEEVLLNPDTMIKILTELKKEREEKKVLQLENKKKDQLLGELKPKADYTDSILKNKGLVTITQIAKDYGISGTEMNETLHYFKVQYKQSGQWLLYSHHHGKGYTHSETIPITHKDGTKAVKMNTKWTQKGRLFIYEILKQEGILPLIERGEETALDEVACTR